jgi:L-ascorbate metabolism protein UlaG (beta-lactamase superfamily)
MVPIGDFHHEWETAAMAVKRFFNLDTVIPCHYGSFPIIDATPDKFVRRDEGARDQSAGPEKGKAVQV